MASTNLDSLPFDIFYQIATLLDDRDYIHLSRTSRAIRDITQSDLLARKTVENVLLYSKEGQSALMNQAGYTYRKAVGHRFDIHEAVATAAPYSVSVIAYGSDFLYNQGVLCYLVGNNIRLLDVHSSGKHERVLNTRDDVFFRLPAGVTNSDAVDRVSLIRYADGILVFQLRRLPQGPTDSDAIDQVSLLQYADDILVFRLVGIGAQDDTIIAIDMGTQPANPKRGLFLLRENVPASAPVFVRHCRTYIWYGVFTTPEDSNGLWTVYGVDLTSPTARTIRFSPDHVVAGDLDQSLCFGIYNEHLYAVSTQVTSDEDEKTSSFYHWLCYVPRQSCRRYKGRLWRREHCEGPINEMWADLSIRTNEITGKPVVLECRREWLDGKSENHRTYYTESLPTPEEAVAGLCHNDLTRSRGPESVSEGISHIRNPNEYRPAKRLRRHYHAEYESTDDQTTRCEFIFAHTKHGCYNLAASTFMDLVNDRPPTADGFRPQDRLRLRTVSRKRKCPIDERDGEGEEGLLLRPKQYGEDKFPLEGSDERFISRGVHLWPPENSPRELNRLLCPDSRVSKVGAISDERSLIYSIQCAGLPPDHKALILISFDPKIHFPTLSSLRTLEVPSSPEKIFPVELSQSKKSSISLVMEDKPLYEAINWGYWLR